MRARLKRVLSYLDRKHGVVLGGYGALVTAVILVTLLPGMMHGVPYMSALVGLCLLTAISFFATHHIKLAMENGRLSTEGRSLDIKAHSDPLTGLMNRMAFHNVLVDLRRQSEPGDIAILFFDLNRFKEVNDSLGHKAGDLLLVEAACILRSHLGEAYAIARMGGDEFAAILPETNDIRPDDRAHAIAYALRQPFTIEGHHVQIGTAIGIAYGNLAYDEGEELLKRADLAMYEAKSAGQNSYRVFDDNMEERLSARTNIRSELTRAIAENELQLVYQPILSTRGGEMKSAEALLRWKSSRLGDVSPSMMIPIAEESGQIIELSNWVIDQALLAIRTLGDVAIGINISPLHFRQNRFATMVIDKLLAANVRPDLLYIEITEGVLISHMEQAKRTITQLRQIGVRVFLDDFGTGYSSLSYLQNFELDGMKIDKSFLRNIGQRAQATQIMRSVIDLGHSLNLDVVCEGIETDWQARLLQLLNCDLLQGFHFATPMTLDALRDYQAGQNETHAAQVLRQPVPASLEEVMKAAS